MTTLRALGCLVALVDTGSVTGAAAALQMSQPALSHQIAALEKEIGTPVVQRLGRGVRVTAAGLAALADAVSFTDLADQPFVHYAPDNGLRIGSSSTRWCAPTAHAGPPSWQRPAWA